MMQKNLHIRRCFEMKNRLNKKEKRKIKEEERDIEGIANIDK